MYGKEVATDSDPVSLQDVDPDLILLITFKLIAEVCQNIR